MTTLYDFQQKTLDGKDRKLSDFKGKAVLVVNVASKCGLTPQYTGLQKIHDQYSARGFAVLGFPCNQFAGQEPGSAQEIAEFCERNYGVTFPMFSKIDVNGANRAPLYQWLTTQPTQPDGPGDIVWNFGKFLVDKNGAVVARFNPRVAPDAPELTAAIEKALG
ncbi:MAG TPA: glutathione peroxidase [Myxococcota bacterium]|nr:glutathione peroxidase [Myxococcota bacterium]